MKALSIRAPWWWFILYAGKDIENRPWNCHKRGPIAIQASKFWSRNAIIDDWNGALRFLLMDGQSILGLPILGDVMPIMESMRGHVVGTTEITGCVQESESPWFFGPNGIILKNSKPIAEPFPFKGKLSFFDVPFDLEDLAGE